MFGALNERDTYFRKNTKRTTENRAKRVHANLLVVCGGRGGGVSRTRRAIFDGFLNFIFHGFYFRFACVLRGDSTERARARAAHDLTSRRQVAHSMAAVCVHKSRSPAAAAAAVAQNTHTRARAARARVQKNERTYRTIGLTCSNSEFRVNSTVFRLGDRDPRKSERHRHGASLHHRRAYFPKYIAPAANSEYTITRTVSPSVDPAC